KVSWDLWTFPLFDDKLPTADYYAQMQVYLHLTGLKKGRVVYVLLETPEELLWNEVQDYSHIDPKYRIKDFPIDYDPEFIEMLQTRVIECRNYLKTNIL